MMTGSSVSLVGISSDDKVNKDALFFETDTENETSTRFLPYRSKLMSTISEDWRFVKKRIWKLKNLQKDSDDKS
ncbi:Hypothetical predicted protein [Octopus vulgaris]|uniref:Uncharacterized protein n=1 Tax=Octopus vulgaris TaxID=6645 RepID=A0AA36B3D1_OCTVU|nr:Hypothetical predicted protein [Octopus vulgaris]